MRCHTRSAPHLGDASRHAAGRPALRSAWRSPHVLRSSAGSCCSRSSVASCSTPSSPGNAAGLNAAILMAAFLTAALLVAGREGIRRMDPADAWLAPAALLLASMAVVRADHWLVTLDLLLAAVLAAGAVGCLAGGRVTRGLVPRVLELAVGAVAAAAIGAGSVLRAPRPGTAGIAATAAPSRWRRLGDDSAGVRRSRVACSSPCRSSPCSWPCSPPPMPSSPG